MGSVGWRATRPSRRGPKGERRSAVAALGPAEVVDTVSIADQFQPNTAALATGRYALVPMIERAFQFRPT